MDVEPQYPVDTATQHGIDAAAGAGDVPTDAANLAEYMNEGLNQKESGGAGKNRSSAGRGSGPNGERLKVRAVIVKRTTNGSRPEGGRGGRGGGRAGSAPTKVRLGTNACHGDDAIPKSTQLSNPETRAGTRTQNSRSLPPMYNPSAREGDETRGRFRVRQHSRQGRSCRGAYRGGSVERGGRYRARHVPRDERFPESVRVQVNKVPNGRNAVDARGRQAGFAAV
jgi:hypothetical protein